MSVADNAELRMPLKDWLVLKEQLEDANKRVSELTVQLNEARVADPLERVKGLATLSRELLKIVQFAMGNCSPRDVKRWPWIALNFSAELLPQLPDHNTHDDELAAEMHRFAAECAEWDRKRAAVPEKEIPPPFPVEQHPFSRLAPMQTQPGGELVELPTIDGAKSDDGKIA